MEIFQLKEYSPSEYSNNFMKLLDKIHKISYFRKMSNYKNDPLINLSNIFKALGNPSRLKIFLRLASCCRPGSLPEERPLNYVGELGADLSLAPSTLSHHLKELQRANLIQTRRSGQNIECWVTPETLDGLADFFKKAGYE